MKQKEKLDQLILRILKEEMDKDNPFASTTPDKEKEIEDMIGDLNKTGDQQKLIDFIKKELEQAKKTTKEGEYAGKSSLPKAKQDPNYNKLSTTTKKEVDDALIAGKKVTLESEDPTKESKQPELQEGPCGSCIAGQLNELMDKLKALGEAAKDAKHKKYADKTMKYLDAAKTALESVVAHEAMLEEKSLAEQTKLAEKHLKEIRKNVSKKIKDEAIVEKIMSKMNPHSIMAMKKKKGGELDEEKVAEAMLKVALNENFIPKTSLNEAVKYKNITSQDVDKILSDDSYAVESNYDHNKSRQAVDQILGSANRMKLKSSDFDNIDDLEMLLFKDSDENQKYILKKKNDTWSIGKV